MCDVLKAEYKGFTAFQIENSQIGVKIVPALGGKIVSLYSKNSKMPGREYLYQKAGDVCVVPYGGDYLKSEMCGVDDMFPTISEEYYMDYPFKGTHLPDHGEVWALPWHHSIQNGSLELGVYGVRLPYLLSKTISLSENRMHCAYQLRNLSAFDIEYIWCAHIMLRSQRGSRFDIFSNDTKAVTTYSESGKLGGYGNKFDYPFIKFHGGDIYDASVLRGKEANDFQKFYFEEPLKEGRVALVHEDGSGIRVEFDPTKTPWLALINAEGGSFGVHCSYIEPCSAPFDSIQAAKLRGRQGVIKPQSTLEWFLDFIIF